MGSFDAVVIGGGVLGCFAARALTRWKLSVALLEAREDVCTGITRANTAIIYPGYDHKTGTMKAEMTVRANARMERLQQRLSHTGVRLRLGRQVHSVSKEKTAVVSGGGSLETISFEKMILAAGCRERGIGSLLLGGTRPAGVFTAGQAQEMINLCRWSIGQRSVIVGSGDLGMIMARRFTLEGKTVVAVLCRELPPRPRHGRVCRGRRRDGRASGGSVYRKASDLPQFTPNGLKINGIYGMTGK